LAEVNGEKRPLQSKKFVAYLVAEATWKIVLVVLIFFGKESLPTSLFVLMLAVVLVAGFIETAYLLGQAGLDKYVRLAQIIANGNGNGKTNGSVAEIVSKGTRGLVSPPKPEGGEDPDQDPDQDG